MIDDRQIDEMLRLAGERLRATAPGLGESQRALDHLDQTEPVLRRGRTRRSWIVLAGAAAALIVVASFLAFDRDPGSVRTVPVTAPDDGTPIEPEATVATTSAPPTSTPDAPLRFPAAADGPEIGIPETRRFEGLPLGDVAVSPSADRIAVARGDELCVLSTAADVPADADACTSIAGGIGRGSMTWRPDGTSLVLHGDVFGLGLDPDLIELDLDDGSIDVLTEDGTDRIGEEDGADADIDVAPVFLSDGTLLFFRVDTDGAFASGLVRLDDDGVVAETGVSVGGVPGRGSRAAGDGASVVVMTTGESGVTSLVSIDSVRATSRVIVVEAPGLVVTSVAGSRALLSDVGAGGPAAVGVVVADFDTGQLQSLEIPGLESSSSDLVGAGLSPDGSRMVVLLADRSEAADHRLLVADLAGDGTIGPLAELGAGDAIAPGGDAIIRPSGLGAPGEVVWTESALLYALGPDQIVTLPLG